MKKVWLVAALVGLSAMASSVFADVQNIRLSGDVRVRGYYLNNANSPTAAPLSMNNKDTSFITQRTRITLEADLEDHVLVVVTLAAEGYWGSGQQSYDAIGKTTEKKWAVGISEAYVQFSEMFFTPATLKLGRQYLNYGKGLVLSSVDQNYNYDAGRLVLDFYPFTVDIVGAKMSDNGQNGATFGPSGNPGHSGQTLVFGNLRYEMKDSIVKDVEAYVAWLGNGSANAPFGSAPTTPAASPWIVGLRTDLTPVKGLNVWLEGAYEGGSAGGAPGTGNGSIAALMANVGAKYTFGKDKKLQPTINANYIYASGGGKGSTSTENAFRPFFDVTEGYNGYVFCPTLANIHIFNVGASIKPAQNVTLSLQGYYYMKADSDTGAGSNANLDFGGLSGWTQYESDAKELGWEVDAIACYDYSKDVRFQLVYGVFLPGNAFVRGNRLIAPPNGLSRMVQEIRAEVNVKF